MATRAEGIAERHARSCRSRDDGMRCNCSPSYQVNLWDGRSQRRIRKTLMCVPLCRLVSKSLCR